MLPKISAHLALVTPASAMCHTASFLVWMGKLYCFQKKSKSGIKTPKQDLDLINARLQVAKFDFESSRPRKE